MAKKKAKIKKGAKKKVQIEHRPEPGAEENLVHLSTLAEAEVVPPDSSREVSVGDLKPGRRFKIGNQSGMVKRQGTGWTEIQFDGESTGTTISKNSSVIPTNGKEIKVKAKEKAKANKVQKVEKKIKEESKKSLKTERKVNGGHSKGAKDWDALLKDLPKKFIRSYKGKNFTVTKEKNGWSVSGGKPGSIRDAMKLIVQNGGNWTPDNFFKSIKPAS